MSMTTAPQQRPTPPAKTPPSLQVRSSAEGWARPAPTRWQLWSRWMRKLLDQYATLLFLSAVAAISVLASLDPGGSYPQFSQGPGLTIDESFNVQQGVYLTEALKVYGIGLFDPATVREVFAPPMYLPDHPPLGRLWLGVHHNVLRAYSPPHDPAGPFVTACARAGSATAFALTVFLLGAWAQRRWNLMVGCTVAALYAYSPRVFAHAHIASLETVTNLMYLLTLVTWTHFLGTEEKPRATHAILPGIVWGLALLTKVQAVLLAPALIIWMCYRWRQSSVPLLLVAGGSALLTMLALWPYLWLDPLGHLAEYLGRTTQRAELSAWYLGAKYGDRSLPWHAPWVILAVTTPLAVLALAGLGFARAAERGARPVPGLGLMVLGALVPLVVFSVPGVACYDMERLFLISVPPLCLVGGAGLARLYRWRGLQFQPTLRFLVSAGALFSVLGPTYIYHPLQLSYFNLSVGGIAGANALGFETTYWGDSLTRDLVQRTATSIPSGSRVAITPVLHQFQVEELKTQSPIIRQHNWQMTADLESADYLLMFTRKADLPEAWRDPANPPTGWERVAATRRGNVILGAAFRRKIESTLEAAPVPEL